MIDSDEAGSHPRPLRRRDGWDCLDGDWEFAFETHGRWDAPAHVRWRHAIRVPYAPETEASGIGDTGFHDVCWYRRLVDPPQLAPGERWMIHFNAVDYHSRVWADGHQIAEHVGGYTPFSADLTPWIRGGDPIELVVRAEDDPQDLAKPRGKQDWQLDPHSIWYPRTSGIWQTVWTERLPETWINGLRWTPSLERWEIGLELQIGGRMRNDLWLSVEMRAQGRIIVCDRYQVMTPDIARRIGLTDPGVDDYRNELLWSPHSPTLIDVKLDLTDGEGNPIDRVRSYTALRSIAVQGQTVVLNGRPFPLRMVLDQGYWDRTGLTPPDSAALRRDVELARAMGFNGVRKHQKVEDPRYLYWADRLGLLVWVEMPSAYRFTTLAVERLTREWIEVVSNHMSHPSVMAWVPFNESWGVPNLPDIAAQREFVQALYHLTKTLDPSRPVIGNDGWESAATDIIGIHDYDEHPDRIAQRYRAHEEIPHLFQRERPGGRMLTLEGHPHSGQPIVLSEFGGIACAATNHKSWGYSMAGDAQDFEERFTSLLSVVRNLPALAGFCYTQFADTYQEANGLLTMDRTPKFPIERTCEAVRGPRQTRQAQAMQVQEQIQRAERGAPGVQHDASAP